MEDFFKNLDKKNEKEFVEREIQNNVKYYILF